MSIHRGLVLLVATVALMFSATVAVAQGELASIQGTVTDDGGRPLEGALLRLHDPSRGRDLSTKTDKSGRFYKRAIPGADYELLVEREGYSPIKDKIRVAAGAEHRFDFKLVKAAPEGANEFARGFEAFGRGDNEAAVREFEAALQKAPGLPEVRVNLALAYLRVSRKADAVAQLEQAAALAPNEPRTLFQLGGAYVEMRDLDKAIGAFERGLGKQPDLNDALAFEATVTLGAVYFAKGESEKSIAQFEKALAVKPGLAVPLLGLAKAYLSKGEMDKALQFFQQVMSTAPGKPEAAEADRFIKEIKKAKPPQ